MKKIAWLDTVRVFSSLLVIVSHYVFCFRDFDNFPIMREFVFHIGKVGVILFFAISGYLVNKSLARSTSLWNFYKWRMIRICIPFATAYVVLGSMLMILSILQPALADYSPFDSAMYDDGFIAGILFSMIPHDVNLTTFLGWGTGVFVGEWFIGTIIWLYILAPFLNRLILRAPLITFAVSIIISVATFYVTESLVHDGRIIWRWWLFPTRIPEFLLGMILAVYKDFFETRRQKLLPIITLWAICAGTALLINSNNPSLLYRLYSDTPSSLFISLPTIYLFFAFAEYIELKCPLVIAHFNSFAGISYISMLIQHIIIYIVKDQLDLSKLQTFGLIYILFLTTLIIIYTSHFIKTFSDPLENFFLKRKQPVI